MRETILEIHDLKIEFNTLDGVVYAVNGIDLSLETGETLGIVGESGCGKSVTALSIMQLLDRNTAKITNGSIIYKSRDLLLANENEMRSIRGNEIAMIFQEPMTSLNPILSIGEQLGEIIQLHLGIKGDEKKKTCIGLLNTVKIPRAENIIKEYPHQLSGGMRQRVMIAMAISCNPKILIADEPTTALDVTIQAQILDLMKELTTSNRTSLVFITHDLGVIAEMADRVVVMYAGTIMEEATTIDLFETPIHPYTLGLLKARPSMYERGEKLVSIPGVVPNLYEIPKGCSFAPRCPYVTGLCKEEKPALREVSPKHFVRCFNR